MLSIGDLAHRTGVSRRRLRHWDELGLLVPTSVDARTGYRRYVPSQAGRVHAIAALQALGFGLEQVADLLSAELTADRLTKLLRERESDLAREAEDAAARLAEVRRRLRSIERGHAMTHNTLQLSSLPVLRLTALTAEVTDESEIRDAATRLTESVRTVHPTADLHYLYDGTRDDAIRVSVGIEGGLGLDGAETVEAEPDARGVTVSYERSPGDIGDAWLAVDAALETYGLQTCGVHRQRSRPDGAVELRAGVTELGRPRERDL